MTTTNEIKRVTKAMRFEDIKAIINGEGVTYGTTKEEAIVFIEEEIEKLAKKNSTRNENKKPTATQIANENYKILILNYLSTQVEGVSCTEIMRAVPELNEFNSQKIAALMR